MFNSRSNYLKKELYELVRQDERIFDFIQSSALDGLWYWDLENTVEEWMNPRFWTVLGYDPEEMPHKSAAWKDIIHPEDLKVATENFTRHCEDPNHPYDQTVRYTHRNGSTIWIRCRGMAIRDEEGKPVRMLGAHQDVTDLKQKEADLLATEARFNQLAASRGSVVWEVDAQGRFTYLSSSVESVLGYQSQELVGKSHFYDLHPEADRDSFKEAVFEAFGRRESFKNFENQVVTKSGTTLWISTNGLPVIDADGELIGYQGVDTDITERKQDEKQLKVLGCLADSHSTMVVVTDAERKTEWANEAFWKLTGYAEEEVIGHNPGHLLQGPDPDQDLIRRMSETLDQEKPFQCEIQNYTKNGEPYWIYMDIQPVHDSDGVLQHFVSVQRDITERLSLAHEIEETLHRLQVSTEAGNIGVWEYLPGEDRLVWDQRMHQLYGIPEGSFSGNFEDWRRNVHPEDIPLAEDAFQEALEGIRPFHVEFRVQHPELGLRYLTGDAKAVRDEKGRPTHVYGVNQDITERKSIEEKLLRQTIFQQELISVSNQFINPSSKDASETIQQALNLLGRFTETDRVYIFRYDPATSTCCNTYEWCAEGVSPEIENLQAVPIDLIPEFVEAHFAGNSLYIADVRDLPPENSTRQVLEPQGIQSLLALPMMEGEECVGFIGFDSVRQKHAFFEEEQDLLKFFSLMLVSVQKRQRMENDLKSARDKAEAANQAKTQFLANMSHEIRTPMNGVIGLTNLLIDSGLNEEQHSYAEMALQSADSLMELIEEILDFSKMEEGQLSLNAAEFDPVKLAEDLVGVMSVQAKKKNLKLHSEIDPDLPRQVEGDAGRLQQVLNNLLSNALKFTEEGEVTLLVRRAREKEVFISQDPGRICLELTVRDTGIGIPEDKLERIFERFEQIDASHARKYGGTGLGLAISKQLVELMGGTIEVESTLGKGSTFRFAVYFDGIAPPDGTESE